MGNQTSPGVVANEVDLTAIIPSVSTSIGATAGVYNWGPIDEVVLVDTETTLVERFGKPSNRNAETWFSAANFLAYADKLYVSRAANTTDFANGTLSAYGNTGAIANNAHVLGTIKNEDDFKAKEGTLDSGFSFIAKYPGALGNSLRISICDTEAGYASNVAITSNTVTGSVVFGVGSSTATFTFTPIGNTLISVANTMATNVIAGLAEGDYITVGNTLIGEQSLKIDTIDTVPTGNSTVITFNTTFASPYRLRANTTITTSVPRKWEFHNLVSSAPTTSEYVTAYGNSAAKDELHVVVVDAGGKFSGVPGTVLETYRDLSRATDAVTDNNTSIYYREVINTRSPYIWIPNDRTGAVSNTALNVVTATAPANHPVINTRLANGKDGDSESSANLAPLYAAWEKFASTDEIEVDLLIVGKSVGGIAGEQLANFITDNISETRADCVPFFSLPYAAVVNNKGRERVDALAFEELTRDTSYRFLDSGYKYQEDRYNGVYRWIPLNGDMAGLAARTDRTKDSWWSFAGLNRGQIKNCIKLAWSPSKSERDIIYPKGINPVVTFQGEGTFLYGDRTGLSKASAFDRINVRRLFITLRRSISRAAKYSLFEMNDEFTRAQFKNMVVPFLKDVQGRRGITDFIVICDSSNNPGVVVDRNEFVADIYIKPARSINYISLNFVAVGTDVSFSSVIGKF